MGKAETKASMCRSTGDLDCECDDRIPLVSRADFAADVAGRLDTLLKRWLATGSDWTGWESEIRALAAQIRKEGE